MGAVGVVVLRRGGVDKRNNKDYADFYHEDCLAVRWR
jgi:hypothetical protein